MVLTYSHGNVTTDGSEQNLFDITSDSHFATWIFTHNMQSGDAVTIRVYVYDENTTTLRLYDLQGLVGVQSSPAIFIPFLPSRRYKVSIQRTAGTDRLYSWQRLQG
jgi:hypothetical protein